MSRPAVTRHFVDVGDRVVHYRAAGRGFPVILLHQSPRSSADMLGLMGRWADDFLCIAPDTPGFGESDRLKGPVPLERLAQAVIDLADALGLKRFGLYGVHTGAILAVAAGVARPDRVAAVAAHGYGAWTPQERAIFGDRYAPPFRPVASGAHLTWLWSRVADQRLFFPWNDWRHGQRLAWGEGTPAELHEEALDLLRAGDAYRSGYLAAFQSDAALPARLATPSLLVASRPDPLSGHLERLAAPPSGVEHRLTDTWDGAEAASRQFLRDHAGEPAEIAGAPCRTHRFVDIRDDAFEGRLHLGLKPGRGAGALLVHGPGGSHRTALDAAARRRGPLAALDWPGHGLSDAADGALTPADYARLAARAIETLDTAPARLVAEGLAHGLVPAIGDATGLTPDPAPPPRALSRPDLGKRWLPNLTPDAEGAHLLRAWNAVRRQAVFDPWYEPTPVNATPPGDLRPAALARRHLALLQAPGAQALLAACVAPPDR
ncbi:alpha/beta fold hydrolase [Caulobacter hibisci]|uniref:AB hydrolase-1 domain-containing protein n=1 Tax=Caulobacter hibisci TaxID=2035993 RepID=A0ABS0SYL8_9CAUL|nr:alpha/beta fold hydrolase [Caulobacter hibisci]MBI1684723.1 hypothetical protein [Caulobacter hibisci]